MATESSNKKTARLAVTALLFLGILLLAASPVPWQGSTAFANGRATLVISEASGPYQVDISLLPGQAVVGKTHISVLLRSLESGDVLTSADVMVSAKGPLGATAIERLPAVNLFSPNFFETDLPFDMAGDWEVMLDISSDLGETMLMVLLEVRKGGGGINTILIAAFVVIALAVGVFIWGRFPNRQRTGG